MPEKAQVLKLMSVKKFDSCFIQRLAESVLTFGIDLPGWERMQTRQKQTRQGHKEGGRGGGKKARERRHRSSLTSPDDQSEDNFGGQNTHRDLNMITDTRDRSGMLRIPRSKTTQTHTR